MDKDWPTNGKTHKKEEETGWDKRENKE